VFSSYKISRKNNVCPKKKHNIIIFMFSLKQNYKIFLFYIHKCILLGRLAHRLEKVNYDKTHSIFSFKKYQEIVSKILVAIHVNSNPTILIQFLFENPSQVCSLVTHDRDITRRKGLQCLKCRLFW